MKQKKSLFFFFRSSCSHHRNTMESPPTSPQIQSYFEGPSQTGRNTPVNTSLRGFFSGLWKQDQSETGWVKTSLRDLFSKSDSHNSTDTRALKRNRSMSSLGFHGVGSGQIFSSPRDQSRSLSSSMISDSSHPQHDPSLQCPTSLTLEKLPTKVSDVPASPNTPDLGKSSTASSKTSHHSSGSSFTCSRNVSSTIVKTSLGGLFSSLRKQDQSETGKVRTSLRDLFSQSDSHNSTDSPALRSNSSMSSACSLGVGSGPIDFSYPTDQCRSSTSTIRSEPSFRCWLRSNNIRDLYIDREQEQEQERSRPKNHFQGNFTRSGNVYSKEAEDKTDVELQRTYKEAEERVLLKSQEIEQESFLLDTDVSETIRALAVDTRYLALEVSDLLQSHIERAFAQEELNLVKTELECQTRRLGKEKTELQLGLERKLDCRSGGWSSKLEKYESEEQKLCEGVIELAEQNVSVWREISSFNGRDTESRSKMEQQLKELITRLEDMKDENQDLRKNLSELQDKCRAAEEGHVCIQKHFEDKDEECKELHKSVTRLVRTCFEQETTIDCLREGVGKINVLKKKVELLDEVVLLMEGEITILQDMIENKQLDLINQGSSNLTIPIHHMQAGNEDHSSIIPIQNVFLG